MKLISKLSILLFLFLSHSSISQALKNSTLQEQEVVNSRTPLDSNRYRKIQAHKAQQKQIIIDAGEKDKKQLKTAKSEEVIPIPKSQNGSTLDQLISQYWKVQNEIQKAKSENDLGRIADLEKSSMACRNSYIYAFENIKDSETSREQQKLYRAFKKDFAYE